MQYPPCVRATGEVAVPASALEHSKSSFPHGRKRGFLLFEDIKLRNPPMTSIVRLAKRYKISALQRLGMMKQRSQLQMRQGQPLFQYAVELFQECCSRERPRLSPELSIH